MSQKTAAGVGESVTTHQTTGGADSPAAHGRSSYCGRVSDETDATTFSGGSLLVVAFEGWNDAGEAASGAARAIRDQLELQPILELEPEDYFDYQFNRPTVSVDEAGDRVLEWPSVTL